MLAKATPSWHSALASDAKSYVLNVAVMAQRVFLQIQSLDSALRIGVNPTPIVSISSVSGSMTTEAISSTSPGGPLLTATSSLSTNPGGPLITATSSSTQPGGPLASASSAAASSTSSAGAVPTTIASGLLGALGVLGVALAL
ncbi:hypothetical protein BP5796_00354 [Coleophoma crateriformis]|uniref:Uncharacterized protein n=1 Tax=Coleophoma crateriformis TaxID=565419 RepID=A0A3D8T837_9HELO|nr:hypothetical protein BP5796_00354 [Coleophoma crateriformis]